MKSKVIVSRRDVVKFYSTIGLSAFHDTKAYFFQGWIKALEPLIASTLAILFLFIFGAKSIFLSEIAVGIAALAGYLAWVLLVFILNVILAPVRIHAELRSQATKLSWEEIELEVSHRMPWIFMVLVWC